jgi:hypothetical protein
MSPLFRRKKTATVDLDDTSAVGVYFTHLQRIEQGYTNFIVDHLDRLHRPGGYLQEKRENDFMDLGMKRTYLDALDDIEFEVVRAIMEPQTRGRKRGSGKHVTEWQVRGTFSRPLLGVPPTGEPTTIRGMTYTVLRDYRIRVEYTYWDLPELTRKVFARQ